jgi:hypothetical protein
MKYNHMYTIAFEVKTDNSAERVGEHEILAALAGRLQDVIAHKGLIFEAVGAPDDSVDESSNEPQS